MSGTDELTDLYAAIEESSRLMEVPFSREKVWPILAAYGDALMEQVVAFRVSTGARAAGELDCRFMLPADVDPYAVALEKGLTPKLDHPVGSLIGELHREFPIDASAVDFGVVTGFTKTWTFFALDDLQSVSELIGLPSLPPSIAGNLDFFTTYGLTDRVSLIGIDYVAKSVNLYFGAAPREIFSADGITSMLRDAGLPAPSDELVQLGAQAFGIYTTLTWDSPRIERLTLSRMTPDPMSLPVTIGPRIEHFVKNAPYNTEDRQFVFAIAATASGEYHKLQSYYKWQPEVENQLLVNATGDTPGAPTQG
ncbi:MAG: prenyltransferase [Streptomyces sp.]|nr:prenyltransferase [Streptomyces sp.]